MRGYNIHHYSLNKRKGLLMKRIIVFVLLLFTPLVLYAAEVKFPPLSGPVVDAANQIPDNQEAILSKELKQFQKDSGHQFVVVTVPDLQEKAAGDYALEFGRHHGIGRKDIDDGMILLQYPGDGTKGSAKISIRVGRGMEYILTDAQMSSIIRNTMGSIVKQERPRSETMPEAILAGAREMMRLGRITEEQKIEFDKKEKEAAAKRNKEAWDSFSTFISWVGVIVFFVLASLIVYWLATAKKRKQKAKEFDDALQLQINNTRERIRQEEIERKRAAEEKRKAREDMLKAMSPQAREIYLAQEESALRVQMERQRQERARAREAAAIRNAEEERQRKVREQRRREEESSFDYIAPIVILGSGGSSGSYDSPSNDSDRNYSGGGGDFGGGGADGDM